MEIEQNNSYVVGTWGGNGGRSWDDETFSGVREIKLLYNLCIDSIVVAYDDQQGQPFTAQKHGGVGGNNSAVLEYPDEFLMSVWGHYGPLDARTGGDAYVRALTFKSNRRPFGPFGVEEGKRFSFSAYPIHEIVGFHG